jgi:hypothetical protein
MIVVFFCRIFAVALALCLAMIAPDGHGEFRLTLRVAARYLSIAVCGGLGLGSGFPLRSPSAP